MPLKRKNFLKMYADTMDNVTGDGVWSGRGIGVPVLGAMFGGDDYKEKIGREKIPWYLSDFRGQPSMAADAGWSGISMSRVNKGYDELYEPKAMFPEQDVKESDEDNNYISRIEKKLGGERVADIKEYFDEDLMVLLPSYTLFNSDRYLSEDVFKWRDLVPDAVEDANWRDFVPDELEDEAEEAYEYVSDLLDRAKEVGRPAYDLLSDKVEELTGGGIPIEKIKDVVFEVGRDFLALTAAGIPVIGTPIAASYVIFNLKELQISQMNAMKGVDRLMLEGSYSSVSNLQAISAAMFDDYVDLLQAAVYLIPFVGAGKGVLGLAGRFLKGGKVGAATSFVGLGGSGALKSAIKSEILLNPIFKLVANISDSEEVDDFGIDPAWFHNIVIEAPATLVTLSDILEEASEQYNNWSMAGGSGVFKFNPSNLGVSPQAMSQAHERFEGDTYESMVDDLISDNMRKIKQSLVDVAALGRDQLVNIFEAQKMNNDFKLLRTFIRETLSYSAPEGSDPRPTGYRYRQPPDTDEDDDSGSMGSGKDAVNYKTDMGYVSYQSRPEDLREEALRRIIRRSIKESKKKYR
jgi:nucleotide-binding universal stress UspA family protein